MHAHVLDVNCVPRSVVKTSGTPNLATHVLTNASAHCSAVIPDKGIASGHLVVLSMMVSR
jgi:hypothetical protein